MWTEREPWPAGTDPAGKGESTVDEDDLPVDAMMALIQGAYGELRNPTQLRAHVATIINATEELADDYPEGDERAKVTLRAYMSLPRLWWDDDIPCLDDDE